MEYLVPIILVVCVTLATVAYMVLGAFFAFCETCEAVANKNQKGPNMPHPTTRAEFQQEIEALIRHAERALDSDDYETLLEQMAEHCSDTLNARYKTKDDLCCDE